MVSNVVIHDGEAGPDLCEISIEIDGVLWTSWGWGLKAREKTLQQAQRIAELFREASPAALDGQFVRKPGRLGVRHLKSCRLSPEHAMSDGIEGRARQEARDALARAQAAQPAEGG